MSPGCFTCVRSCKVTHSCAYCTFEIHRCVISYAHCLLASHRLDFAASGPGDSSASMLHARPPLVRNARCHSRNSTAPVCPLHQPATWSTSWGAPLPQHLRHTPSSSHPAGGRSPLAVGSGVDLSALGIDIPDIDADVASYQSQLGAVFDVSSWQCQTAAGARSACSGWCTSR